MEERLEKIEQLLESEEFVLILGDGSIHLLMPKDLPDDAPMPLHGAFLSGCAVTATFMFGGEDKEGVLESLAELGKD